MFESTTCHASFLDFFINLRRYTFIGKQLNIDFKWQKQDSLSSFRPLTGWGACTNFFENFRESSLKRDLSNDTTVSPPPFSLVNTFKRDAWPALRITSERMLYRRGKKCQDRDGRKEGADLVSDKSCSTTGDSPN
jgi:hypothetical protein